MGNVAQTDKRSRPAQLRRQAEPKENRLMPRQTNKRKIRLSVETLEPRTLLAVGGYAPIDGYGNNIANPDFGAAFQQFLRLSPAAYEDGISLPARTGARKRTLSKP